MIFEVLLRTNDDTMEVSCNQLQLYPFTLMPYHSIYNSSLCFTIM